MGLPWRAVRRSAQNAYMRGRRRHEFKGRFRKYLDGLYEKGQATQSATDIVVYGDNIFLFAGNCLVTMWPVIDSVWRVENADGKKSYQQMPA